MAAGLSLNAVIKAFKTIFERTKESRENGNETETLLIEARKPRKRNNGIEEEARIKEEYKQCFEELESFVFDEK